MGFLPKYLLSPSAIFYFPTNGTAFAKIAVQKAKLKGRYNEYSSADYSNSPTRRSLANVAVQLWLGILPERPPRLGLDHNHYSGLNGPAVIGP
jgi:hypothetical protein